LSARRLHWTQLIARAPLVEQPVDPLNERRVVHLLIILALQFVASAMRSQQTVDALDECAVTPRGSCEVLRFLLLFLETSPVKELIGDVGAKEQDEEDDRDEDTHAVGDVAPRRVGGLDKREQHERRDDHREELGVIFRPIAIEDLSPLSQPRAKEEGK